MQIATVLDQIDLGGIALPEFQRGYVWNRDQVRQLMASLYRKHPVGSLLVWTTQPDSVSSRGKSGTASGTVKLLLDGQQRITTLYGIIRGKPPQFFDGNARTFTGLYFHLDEETFEFYAPMKMKDNPCWIDVTHLMRTGVGEAIKPIFSNPELQVKFTDYLNRLNALDSIKSIDLHVEEVTGEDKSIDVVVDIFNRVNSGGTKLSHGDLALAKVCASWPEARQEMSRRLTKWRNAGFSFRLEWLLRCITTLLTGEARFSALRDVGTFKFREGLDAAEAAIDYLLNLFASRLGLDHDRVLGSRYSFPVLARHLHMRGGKLSGYKEQGKLLYWYAHTFLWGRYAGSTESALNQDLEVIDADTNSIDRLISKLRQTRGNLRLQPNDFHGWGRNARFYPLLYMMTRVGKACDWESGVTLSIHLLGRLSQLQVHHIFPKALLYAHGHNRMDVNALANLTFLTQATNLAIGNREPEEYLEEYANKHPGAVASHWIPLDRKLWKVENYIEFLAARREQLAEAANAYLDSLLGGTIEEPVEVIEGSILEREVDVVPGGIESEEEERQLEEINTWVVEQGLPEGESPFELTDESTGELRAVLDLAWPGGLQEGYSQPVALLLDERHETLETATHAGYRYFTDPAAFKRYILKEVLASSEADA